MAYVVQSIKNGKMYRECTACKTDVTFVTMYITYKFCPYCGAKNESRRAIEKV